MHFFFLKKSGGGGVISMIVCCIFAENSVYEKSPVYIVIAYIVIVMFAS